MDGKTVRGSRGEGIDARHLMAAIDHDPAVVYGQVDVEAKTNEIPMFAQLIDRISDMADVVVTADALHAQKAHADYLVLQRSAHYLLSVKGNQPSLHDQLKNLPWKNVPVGHSTTDREHGRVAKREYKIVTVTAGIVFPHARQAIQITRRTKRIGAKKCEGPSKVRIADPLGSYSEGKCICVDET